MIRISTQAKVGAKLLVAAASLSWLLVSCGDGQNLNSYLVAENEDQAVDHLVDRATYYFDRGELDTAAQYANRAHAINPTNEEAVLIKGYINLSEAGVGVFQLTKKLMDLGNDSEGAASLFMNAAESSSDASGFLSKLGTLVGDKSELEKIKGTERVGSGLFQSLNYKPPLKATESRTKEVTVITKTNEALRAVCPLVHRDAKVLDTDTSHGDVRHEQDYCQGSDRATQSSARVHFIWSLAHLMEGTAFNLVLVPALTTLEKQAAVASLKPGERTDAGVEVNVAGSIGAFTTLATAIDDILPSGADSQNSMLSGMLNDLDATAKGFGQIPGIPDSMVNKLTESINSFRSKQNQFANAGKNAGASSLKDQLLSKVGTAVSKYIKTPPPGATLTPQQETEACEALAAISPIELAAAKAAGKCGGTP